MFSFFSEFRTAQKLAEQKFHVIFYAENSYSFQYLRHLYEALVVLPGIRIAYLTSEKNDPVLDDTRVQAFYLKNTLAGIFPRLQANLLIMTMPDLQNFIIKKSPAVGKYIYVFHALVSTHQQYRSRAFEHYDTLFCTGPQQEREIREAEQLYALPPKECISYGYPLLEDLKAKLNSSVVKENKILIAPSWYKAGIFDTCIVPLIAELSKEDFEVWIRPHPEFVKRHKDAYVQLVKQSREKTNIQFDTSPSVYTHLADAGHLITDRSGIGLEYALASGRPVLWIDTPLKILNPEINKFSIAPLENRVRSRLGESVLPGELHRVSDVLHKQKRSAEYYRTSIVEVEQEIVFPPACLQNGIQYIRNQLLL